MHGEKPNHQEPQQAEGASEQKVQLRRSYEGNEIQNEENRQQWEEKTDMRRAAVLHSQ